MPVDVKNVSRLGHPVPAVLVVVLDVETVLVLDDVLVVVTIADVLVLLLVLDELLVDELFDVLVLVLVVLCVVLLVLVVLCEVLVLLDVLVVLTTCDVVVWLDVVVLDELVLDVLLLDVEVLVVGCTGQLLKSIWVQLLVQTSAPPGDPGHVWPPKLVPSQISPGSMMPLPHSWSDVLVLVDVLDDELLDVLSDVLDEVDVEVLVVVLGGNGQLLKSICVQLLMQTRAPPGESGHVTPPKSWVSHASPGSFTPLPHVGSVLVDVLVLVDVVEDVVLVLVTVPVMVVTIDVEVRVVVVMVVLRDVLVLVVVTVVVGVLHWQSTHTWPTLQPDAEPVISHCSPGSR